MATAWQPVIGSSFDSLAGQQQYWGGLNAQTERANIQAQQDAAAQRNAYLFQQAQLAREKAAQQFQAQQAAKAAATQAYQFNASMALDKSRYDATNQLNQEKLALGEQADAEDRKDKQAQQSMAQSEADQRTRFNQASDEIQENTFDPKNYDDLPPDQLAMLTRAQDAQRQSANQVYFKAVNAANLLNKNSMLQDAIDAAGKTANPAFLAGLQKQKAGLLPALPDSKTQGLLGVYYDANTDKYAPPGPPAWLNSAGDNQLQNNPTSVPTAPPAQPSWMPPSSAAAQNPMGVPPITVSPQTAQPTGQPKVATVEVIRQALAQTGGDRNAARKLLISNGYVIPAAQ